MELEPTMSRKWRHLRVLSSHAPLALFSLRNAPAPSDYVSVSIRMTLGVGGRFGADGYYFLAWFELLTSALPMTMAGLYGMRVYRE